MSSNISSSGRRAFLAPSRLSGGLLLLLLRPARR
jgi:hypothetical protein